MLGKEGRKIITVLFCILCIVNGDIKLGIDLWNTDISNKAAIQLVRVQGEHKSHKYVIKTAFLVLPEYRRTCI